VFRVVYREPCRDCGDAAHRPICDCGYMRPFDDEFRLLPLDRSVSGAGGTWFSTSGGGRRIPPWELREIRDRILAAQDGLHGDGFGDGCGYGLGDGDGLVAGYGGGFGDGAGFGDGSGGDW